MEFVSHGYKRDLLNKQEIRVKKFYGYVKRKYERQKKQEQKKKVESALKKAKDLLK